MFRVDIHAIDTIQKYDRTTQEIFVMYQLLRRLL